MMLCPQKGKTKIIEIWALDRFLYIEIVLVTRVSLSFIESLMPRIFTILKLRTVSAVGLAGIYNHLYIQHREQKIRGMG